MRLCKYFSTKQEFVQFKNDIKLVPCPHCHRIGFLILHGPLSGLCLNTNGEELYRGHRYVCNKRRKNNPGCGGTFSILMDYAVKFMQAGADCLREFLSSLKQGKPKNTTFENKSIPFTARCAYRWLDKLKRYQCNIRNNLLKKTKPPKSDSSSPLIQLLHHLEGAFSGNICPVSAYQYHFQTSFFRD